MPPLIEVHFRDKHCVAFEGTKSCVRMACTCTIGRTGFPCAHKLLTFTSRSSEDFEAWGVHGYSGSASSFYEVLCDWTADSKIAETVRGHMEKMEDYAISEQELLGMEHDLRKVKLEHAAGRGDELDVESAREEVAVFEKALRAARKKAQKSCAKIVRVLNGISATGRPLEQGPSLDARALAKWPTLTPELLADFEERLYAEGVVRARSKLSKR